MKTERDAWGNKRTNNPYYIPQTHGFDFKGFFPRPTEQINEITEKNKPSNAILEEIAKQNNHKQIKKFKLEQVVDDNSKKAITSTQKNSRLNSKFSNKSFTQKDLKEFDYFFDFGYLPHTHITHPYDMDDT